MRQRDKNVLFVSEAVGPTARPLYRAINPAYGLREHGWHTRVCPILYEQEDHTFNGYIPGETEPVATPKFIVAHNFMSPTKEGNLEWESQQQIIETARVHGQKFFFDLDDDIWNIPSNNPASNRLGPLVANYSAWARDVNSSDGLIVSTRSIAESAKSSEDIQVPIHVIGNSINVQDYNNGHEDHQPLRVGWIGDILFRGEDFNQIIPVLYKVFQGLRGDVEFWHIGAKYDIGYPSIRDSLRDFPIDIVERPWMPADQFPKAIEQIDISLIPSVDSRFNNGRSNSLGLACIAGGIPFIASSTTEYGPFETAISNRLEGEWEYELKRMVEHPRYRRAVVEEETDYLINFYTPKKKAEFYIKLFEETCQS